MYRNVVCGKIHIPSQKVICVFCSTVCLLEDNNNVNDYLLLSDYHIQVVRITIFYLIGFSSISSILQPRTREIL